MRQFFDSTKEFYHSADGAGHDHDQHQPRLGPELFVEILSNKKEHDNRYRKLQTERQVWCDRTIA